MKKPLLLLVTFAFVLLSFAACSKQDKNSTVITTSSEESKATTNKEFVTTQTDKVGGKRQIPEWVNSAIVYEVNIRQYTKEGTFEAFSAHLERLQALGVNTLWFMPVYPISETNRKGSLGSYYAITDYTAINPEFGTMDDFKKLVDKAHQMGFRVMMDWVANHTGWDSAWITEHPEWYLQDEAGQIVHPPGTDWDDVAQLNFDNNDLRLAMIDAMKFWVEELDVDGFRCDYATGVPLDFWETAREELSKTKYVYMLAEDDQSKAFLVSAFDSNYNWKFFRGINSVAKGNAKANSIKNIINVNKGFPEGSFPFNFLDNHDENSWNGTLEARMGQDPIKAATTLLFTMPGIPLIYSGQEAGLNKSLQFFEKDQIDWSNYPYEEIISSLSHIKTTNPALYNGSYGGPLTYLEESNDNIIAFTRTKDDNTVTVIINLSKQAQTLTMDTSSLLNSTILLHGEADGPTQSTPKVITSETIENFTELSPWEYYIIAN